MDAKHVGACFCGAVELEAFGEPELMGYCHCRSCQSWSASPVNAFTLWKPENVRFTKGEEFVGRFMKTVEGDSDRHYCTKCGGHLLTGHPAFGIIDVYAATLPSVRFVPSIHLNYTDTVLPMKDDLPKYRDFSSELGGTGERAPE